MGHTIKPQAVSCTKERQEQTHTKGKKQESQHWSNFICIYEVFLPTVATLLTTFDIQKQKLLWLTFNDNCIKETRAVGKGFQDSKSRLIIWIVYIKILILIKCWNHYASMFFVIVYFFCQGAEEHWDEALVVEEQNVKFGVWFISQVANLTLFHSWRFHICKTFDKQHEANEKPWSHKAGRRNSSCVLSGPRNQEINPKANGENRVECPLCTLNVSQLSMHGCPRAYSRCPFLSSWVCNYFHINMWL